MRDKNQGNGSEKPGLDDLITLYEASALSGLTASQLRLLVSKGEMWGRKLGRNWFTTAQAVRDYLSLGRKPAPKPKKKGN
jgi:hypothetical protein